MLRNLSLWSVIGSRNYDKVYYLDKTGDRKDYQANSHRE